MTSIIATFKNVNTGCVWESETCEMTTEAARAQAMKTVRGFSRSGQTVELVSLSEPEGPLADQIVAKLANDPAKLAAVTSAALTGNDLAFTVRDMIVALGITCGADDYLCRDVEAGMIKAGIASLNDHI